VASNLDRFESDRNLCFSAGCGKAVYGTRRVGPGDRLYVALKDRVKIS